MCSPLTVYIFSLFNSDDRLMDIYFDIKGGITYGWPTKDQGVYYIPNYDDEETYFIEIHNNLEKTITSFLDSFTDLFVWVNNKPNRLLTLQELNSEGLSLTKERNVLFTKQIVDELKRSGYFNYITQYKTPKEGTL